MDGVLEVNSDHIETLYASGMELPYVQFGEAETKYRVREALEGFALLEVEPVTGRTHQIRVHLAAIGHPVVGDTVYGKRSQLIDRQFLHAWRLAFDLPSSGRQVEFESPLPPELRAALASLRP